MTFLDLNMGLLGPLFCLSDESVCVGHDAGDQFANRVWSSAYNRQRTRVKGIQTQASAQRVFCYLSHRDVVTWSRSKGQRETWTSRLLNTVGDHKSDQLLICSTKSLVKVQKGYPFLSFCRALSGHGYVVSWVVVSALNFGLPHDVHYTLVFCTSRMSASTFIDNVSRSLHVNLKTEGQPLDLTEFLNERKPRIGQSRRSLRTVSSAGLLASNQATQFSIKYHAVPVDQLAAELSVVAVPENMSLLPTPVRLVSRHGEAGIASKALPASYALGPGTSAYPLFAVNIQEATSQTIEKIKAFSNWSTARHGFLIYRLSPENALGLHGHESRQWAKALASMPDSIGSKYGLISRGCPPRILRPASCMFSASGSDAKQSGPTQ